MADARVPRFAHSPLQRWHDFRHHDRLSKYRPRSMLGYRKRLDDRGRDSLRVRPSL